MDFKQNTDVEELSTMTARWLEASSGIEALLEAQSQPAGYDAKCVGQ
jgi:hypothetical protein